MTIKCNFKHLIIHRLLWPSMMVATFSAFATSIAFADPPPWAPAWGYRAKHDDHEHDHGHKLHGHDNDYEYEHYHYRTYYYSAPEYYDQVNTSILAGTCNRDVIGAMIGGTAGGYIGSTLGKGDGKLVTTAAGALLGFIIGQNVGRSMDQVDVRCTGYVLEAAPDRQEVVWNNPVTGNEYAVTPTRTYMSNDRYCREYTSRAIIGGRAENVYGRACRNPDGSWQIVN